MMASDRQAEDGQCSWHQMPLRLWMGEVGLAVAGWERWESNSSVTMLGR